MRIICSYCREPMGERPPLDDDRLSHGICDDCRDHFTRQWSGLRLGEYLDAFETPVLAVSPDRHVIAANQPMANLMGRSEREMYGLLGGEAAECAYSRRPEGCGNSVHCETCAIRNAVVKARDTGVAVERVEALLDRDDRTLGLLVSAYPESGYIRLVIEDVLSNEPRARP